MRGARYIGLSFAALIVLQAAELPAEDARELKVGAIAILTGTGANYGLYTERGASLAADEINAAGGVRGRRLRLIFEDETGSKAQAALGAYRKLTVDDGVRLILGPNWQDALSVLAPLARREKVFLITPSTPTSEKTPANVFSTWPDPVQEIDLIAPRIRAGAKRLAILSVQQAWEGLVDARLLELFPALGGEIAAHETPPPDASDVRAEVLRVKAAKPDAVFISSYALFGLYAKELRKQRITAPLFGIEVDQAAIDSAGGTAEGLIYVAPSMPDAGFTAKYRSRFGSTPDVPASNAYDAVRMLALAIEEVGDDPQAVAEHFRALREYHGAAGTISSENGRTRMSLSLYAVRAGKFERL